ncbi:hypothetical protein SAMN05444344_0757 [Tenacibaculum mesophilum]|uniref:SprT-like family protein n=1 Tax=Tenacibaculum mesophilum TaxID=104268 RepID=A0ABN5T7W8_9FLAO|nr:hypothetical protein [Tenacibaculum mesophilum]AZJ33448.1 hypothetical protein D6200_13090 [Tenacibaculum mesophilum]QFS28689.1 hypothetical protein F9Y86_09905 [Tenacibaculum mesophilum]SHF60777.1 hypothetical protein SAMN05444344_0757 [Tenacibaculum mesophilum]
MEQRNKQIANLLKLGVFLFGISLLLWNCEKDEIIPNTHTDNTTKPYTLATLNYKELTHDAEFSKSLKKIEKNLSTKNVSSKGSTGKKRLSILTNQIAKIKTKTTISWTFKLENTLKEASVFENLLVRKYNNEFSYFLVSYQGENNTNNGKNTEKSLLYSLSKEDFDFSELDIQARSDSFDTPGEDDGDYGGGGGSTPCNGVWIPEYKSCDAGGNADGHSPQKQWDGSYCSRSQLTGYVIDFSHCTNYTPPGGPSNDIPTDDTSSGGGGSGSSTGGDPIITTPVEDADGNTYTEAQIRANNINRALDNTLSPSDLYYLSDSNNLNLTIEVESFLFENTSPEAKAFTNEAIKNRSIKNIKENFNLTLKSPFKVDMTQVLDSIILPNVNPENKIAAEKFKCIYDKVTKSPKFKDLFIDLFGTNKDINVTFEIADDFVTKPNGRQANGNCGLKNYSLNADGSIKTANVVIKINKNKLTTGSGREISSILMAKTIVHESIHAFLDVKRKDCNAGTTIEHLNNLEFEELIKEYFDGTCATAQEEHEFMFNYLVGTLAPILAEVKDDVIPASQITYVENNPDPVLGIMTDWNWNDFFYNLSLEGLHNTEAFKNKIEKDSRKKALFEHYISGAYGFSKNCN